MRALLPTTFMALLTLAIGGCNRSGPDIPEPGASIADVSGELKGGGSERGAGTTKVAVCHIPPGNPANAHTIVVGQPAVAAHLAHGDTLGACGSSACVGLGGDCTGTACCAPLLCVNGVCEPGDSACGLYDDTCTTNADCCPGLFCVAGPNLCCGVPDNELCPCPDTNPACAF